MSKIRPLALFLMILFIQGCATTAKFESKLNSWVGYSERDLIESWGPPNNVYQVDSNQKIISYNKSMDVALPNFGKTYQTSFVGNTAYTTSYGTDSPGSVNFSCKVSFTIENGMIIAWRHEGNYCY